MTLTSVLSPSSWRSSTGTSGDRAKSAQTETLALAGAVKLAEQ